MALTDLQRRRVWEAWYGGETLWERMHAEDSADRLAGLDERAAELSKIAHAFPVRPRLIRRWHTYVAQHHAARHAA